MAKFGDYTELTVAAVDDLIAVKDISATATKVVEVQNLHAPIHTSGTGPVTYAAIEAQWLSEVGRAAVAGDMMICTGIATYLYIKVHGGDWHAFVADVTYSPA